MDQPGRPFNPEALAPYAVAEIQPPLGGGGALVWRYTVLVPIEETKLGKGSRRLADSEDLDNLGELLCNHFGGLTVLPLLMGYGLRAAHQFDTLEMNQNVPFVVYARPVAASDRYLERLQRELQEALDQGLILAERQEAFVFGSYGSAAPQALARASPGPLADPGQGQPLFLPPQES